MLGGLSVHVNVRSCSSPPQFVCTVSVVFAPGSPTTTFATVRLPSAASGVTVLAAASPGAPVVGAGVLVVGVVGGSVGGAVGGSVGGDVGGSDGVSAGASGGGSAGVSAAGVVVVVVVSSVAEGSVDESSAPADITPPISSAMSANP